MKEFFVSNPVTLAVIGGGARGWGYAAFATRLFRKHPAVGRRFIHTLSAEKAGGPIASCEKECASVTFKTISCRAENRAFRKKTFFPPPGSMPLFRNYESMSVSPEEETRKVMGISASWPVMRAWNS